jgi:hypothetical protein
MYTLLASPLLSHGCLQRFHFRCLQSDRTQRGFSSTGVPGKLACWGGSKAALRFPVLFRVEVKML